MPDLFRSKSASAWELGIKHRLGRLEGAESVLEDFSGNVKRLGAGALDITAEHAFAASALPLHHRDPFNRMLIAPARAEKRR
ncbi:MAG: type II toxin-antitoxin system VapC family toxin [Trueperaceae bacterium]